jgi:hypothetical protein
MCATFAALRLFGTALAAHGLCSVLVGCWVRDHCGCAQAPKCGLQPNTRRRPQRGDGTVNVDVSVNHRVWSPDSGPVWGALLCAMFPELSIIAGTAIVLVCGF